MQIPKQFKICLAEHHKGRFDPFIQNDFKVKIAGANMNLSDHNGATTCPGIGRSGATDSPSLVRHATSFISRSWGAGIVQAPSVVIDYLVVHELAHLLEQNHSPEFWNIVQVHAPAATKARSWLRTHGHHLDW